MLPHRLSALVHHIAAVLGLYIFSRGFLILRQSVGTKSECSVPPVEPLHFHNSSPCWLPPATGKQPRVVMLLVDALRFDMVVPDAQSTSAYRNKLDVLYETYTEHPDHCVLYRFIADPPTATTQRLQGLVAGTLPTFIEVGDSFSDATCDLDNWLWQMLHSPHSRYKRIHFYGDDTWTHLFPVLQAKSEGTVEAYLSFHLFDLHTVDTAIKGSMFPALEAGQFDMLIAHFLGHDHCGHKFGPAHAECGEKLTEMDAVIRQTMARLADDDLLIVLGDHGMTDDGDHGGVSPKEVSSVLFMYSKGERLRLDEALRARIQETRDKLLEVPSLNFFPTHQYFPSLNQIDFVPTLSLLTGIPIPHGNLGRVAADALFLSPHHTIGYVVDAVRVNAHQVRRYLEEASRSEPGLRDMQHYWRRLDRIDAHSQPTHDTFMAYYELLGDVLLHCQRVWAKFDHRLMNVGLLTSCLAMLSIWWQQPNRLPSLVALAHSALMTTTSFVVFEDDLVRFLTSSVLLLVASDMSLRSLLTSLLVVRLSKFVGGCREEQFPYCQALTHRNLSLGASLCLACALLLVSLVRVRTAGRLTVSIFALVHLWWGYWWASDRAWIGSAKAVSDWLPRIILGLSCCSLLDGHRLFDKTVLCLCVLQRPLNGMAFLSSLHIFDHLSGHPQAELVAVLVGQVLFYLTGHQTTLSSLQWETSFIGWPHLNRPVQIILMLLNTLLGPLAASLWVRMELKGKPGQSMLIGSSYSLALGIGCAVACKQLLRHLMIWKVFAPRLIFQACFSLTSLLVGAV